MSPLPRQSRLQIAELGDLDLQFTFQRPRALRKNIKDELRAIDDAQLELTLQIARLRGAEGVIENRQSGALLQRELAYFRRLPSSDKCARIDTLELLPDLSSNRRSGALGKRAEFSEGIIGRDRPGRAGFDSDENGALGIFGQRARITDQSWTSKRYLPMIPESNRRINRCDNPLNRIPQAAPQFVPRI